MRKGSRTTPQFLDYHLGGRVVPFRRLENSSEEPWEDERKTTDLGLYILGLGCLYSGSWPELRYLGVHGWYLGLEGAHQRQIVT